MIYLICPMRGGLPTGAEERGGRMSKRCHFQTGVAFMEYAPTLSRMPDASGAQTEETRISRISCFFVPASDFPMWIVMYPFVRFTATRAYSRAELYITCTTTS